MTQEIINSSESRVSFKIESNSRGNNYTIHINSQCSQEEIDDYPIKANGKVDAVANADEAEDEPIACDVTM
jgi:hypothetical protein